MPEQVAELEHARPKERLWDYSRIVPVDSSLFPKLFQDPKFQSRRESENDAGNVLFTRMYIKIGYPLPDLRDDPENILGNAAKMIKQGADPMDWWRVSLYPDTRLVPLSRSDTLQHLRHSRYLIYDKLPDNLVNVFLDNTMSWYSQGIQQEIDYQLQGSSSPDSAHEETAREFIPAQFENQNMRMAKFMYLVYAFAQGTLKDQNDTPIQTRAQLAEYFRSIGIQSKNQNLLGHMYMYLDKLVSEKFIQTLREENVAIDPEQYFSSVAEARLMDALESTAYAKGKTIELKMAFPAATTMTRVDTSDNELDSAEYAYDIDYLPYAARVCVVYLDTIRHLIPEGKVLYIGDVEQQVSKFKATCKDLIRLKLNGETLDELKGNDPEKYRHLKATYLDLQRSFQQMDAYVKIYQENGSYLNKSVGTPGSAKWPSAQYLRRRIHAAGAPLTKLPKSNPERV